MILKGVIFLCVFALCCNATKDCSNVKRTNSKLVCYYSKLIDVDRCYCTHIILPADADVKLIQNLKQGNSGAKILLTVNEFNEGLVNIVKQHQIDGLELNLKKLSTKDDIAEFISTVRNKLGNNLFLALSIPSKAEFLAKYYDFKALTKSTDLFILQTSFLGVTKNVTFHPSRLSGLWDMQNTDSVVDLVTGLGAPLSRLVVSAPVQAFKFILQDDALTTPGSPALEIKSITRKELCDRMKNKADGSWTLERDQDQAGPYIFKGKEWIAFEDPTSMDIKAKYTRVRGLAGLALKDLNQDLTNQIVDDNNEIICDSLLSAAHSGLSRQTRAPRQVVLRSLEREILETPSNPNLGSVNVSPFRITRIVDVEGHVHSVRKDTRTEFQCSRQGYFVHPHSCGRFYRCVKFDQLIDEFSVFEFDCPAGLVFDERVEVCVWPGNLPQGGPCHGSSEIAPVPRNRYDCPGEQGYYADPENCRWFFACLDHGKSGLTAYEFRCPFGLVFDEKRLLCEWPWLVPTCGNGISGLELDNIDFYGGAAGSTITYGSQASRISVVSSGSNTLDHYDGLGVLGAVPLGGYNGNLQLLKQNVYQQSGYNIGDFNSQFDGFAGHVYVDSGKSNLLANSGLSSGAASQVVELQGQKYSGSLDFNIQYANEPQAVVTSVGVVDKQINDAVLVNNVGLSTHGESALTNYNVAVTPKPDFISLVSQPLHTKQSHSGSSYSSFNQYHSPSVQLQQKVQPIVTEYKTQNIGEGQSYSSFNYQTPVVQPVTEIKTPVVQQQYQYQTPVVHYEQEVQPVVTEIKTPVIQETVVPKVQQSGYSSSYHYQEKAPIVHQQTYEYPAPVVQPIVTEIKTSVDQQEAKQHSYSSAYQYQSPVVHYEQKVQPLVQETVIPVSKVQQSYQYPAPTIHYEQKLQPVVTEIKTPVVQETIVPKVQQSGYSSSYQYQAPAVHYEQKVQPIQQEIVVSAPKVQQTYHYQAPVVQYEHKVQPLVQETVVPKVQQSGYSSSYHYQAPAVHYEQKIQPVVTEIKTPVVQQQTYSSAYQYQSPVVHYEQKVQPVVTEIKTPVVQETVVPKVQQSYSSSYHYQAPAIKYEEKPQIVQQNYEYQTPVVQPIVTEIKTPVVQQQVKQQSYSSAYQYQSPVVHYEQKVQPVVTEIKTPVVQQQSYSSAYQYQNPVVHYEQKVQPVVTEIKTPLVKQQSYSSAYQYQTPVVHYEQKVQPIVTEIKTPVVQQEVKQQSYSSAYQYQSPVVHYEQKVQPIVTEIKTPVVKQQSYSSAYQYQTPVVQYEQKVQPIVTEIKTPVVKQQSYSSAYQYQTPVVHYEQKVQPVVTEIKTPVVKQQSYSSAYQYQSPVVHYEHKVAEIRQPIKQTDSYQYPQIKYEKIEYQAPVLQYEQKVQPVAQIKHTTYSAGYQYQAPVQPIIQKEVVHYEQPAVKVQPIVQNYHHYEQKQEAKSHSQFYGVQHHVQQPQIVVTPKYETVSVTPQYPLVKQPSGFVSVTPTYQTPISYEGRVPVVEEKIVPVKAYQTYTNHVQKAPQVYVSTTPKYQEVFQEYVQPKKTKTYLPPPQVYISSTPKYQETIEIKKPSPTIISQYEYVNPEYANYESKLNINYDHFDTQPTNKPVEQYHTQTAFYSPQDQLIPIKNYQTEFVVSTPKPTFISTIAPIVKQTPTLRTKIVAINKYQTYDDQYLVSAPKQIYVSTPAPNLPPFKYYDSRLEGQKIDYVSSTPKPTFVSTIAPIVKQTPKQFYVSTPAPVDDLPPFTYYDSRYETEQKQYDDYVVSTQKPKPIIVQKKIVSTTPIPVYDYPDTNYGQIQPIVVEKKIVSTTTPIYDYPEANYDYLVSTKKPKPIVVRKKIASTTTPIPLDVYDYPDANYGQYLVEVKPSKQNYYYEDKVKATTFRPAVVKKKKIIVTTTTDNPIDVADYDDYISSVKPKYESIKITPRPKVKGKTVVRVNDFHPFLTTKLGAQCTCTSNTVKLRQGQENVPITKLTKTGPAPFDDYEEPGVYAVGNSDFDDYEYELKKISVTKTPVEIKSITNAVQPAPTPEYIRGRIATRPDSIEVSTKTSRVKAIFVASSSVTTKSRTKEQKIVEAVNEGLSLVKSTVKSAVKEAIAEEGRQFDRFGPGGWRSRGETLQGSVDCQREGLFRHPTQCNKFYACRWDCTKQRYTLHVFNCPVHLTFDTSQGACNWPSKGPACTGNTLLPTS